MSAAPPLRRIQFAVGIGLFLLAAIVVVPIVVQLRTQEFRSVLRETAEPARSAVTDVHVAVANAGALLGDHLLTGDATLLRRFEAAEREAEEAADRLAPFIGRLGPEVARRRDELDARLVRWRESVAALIANGAGDGEALAAQQAAFEDVLLSAALLDRGIMLEAVRQRNAIARAEWAQNLALVVLGPAALVAGLLVVWLAHGLHRHAAEAVRARLEGQRIMESKARLIRGFSHDVKNPLGAADGYAELLEDGVYGPLNSGQQSAVAPLRRLLHTTLRIIEDLVELSRVEAGQLEIRRERVSPHALLEEAVSQYAPAASTKGLELGVDAGEPVPDIHSDRRRVQQILGNLVSNATKYTAAGSIRLRAGLTRRSGAEWVCFEVRDTGPGIPPEKLETIFEEFSRLDPDAVSGAGLGLAISRRLARILGGDLTVSSVAGKGSAFTLLLPGDRAD